MTSKLEQEFFEAMGVIPTMLTDCSYKNMQQHRYEFGDDNCEHLEDFDFTCDMCPKSRQYIPYYPIITDTIVLRLDGVIATYFENEGGAQYLGINSNGYSVYTYLSGKPAISDEYYGNTRTEALLHLCIQLKDEIREEVKELFK